MNYDIVEVPMQDAEYRIRPKGQPNFGSWITYASMPISYLQRRQTSISTPGYNELKKKWLPDNYFHKNEWKLAYSRHEASYFYSYPDGETAEQQFRGPSYIVDAEPFPLESERPDPNAVLDKARMKARALLNQSAGSAAVTLAEINKTASLIADTARTLASAYSYLRHGNLGGFATAVGITVPKRRIRAFYQRTHPPGGLTAAQIQQHAASAWLQYTYGWRPMINDVYTQAENLANYLYKNQGIVHEVIGKASEFKVARSEQLFAPGTWKHTKLVTTRESARVTVRYKMSMDQSQFLNVFGLQNPMLIAWEVVPFSFVVDWFLPVGSFLESLTATAGLDFHSGAESQKTVCASTVRVSPYGVFSDPGYKRTFTVKGSDPKATYRRKLRVTLNDFPTISPPSFKNPVSVSHAISSLALLTAVFSGSPKRPTSTTNYYYSLS